MSSKYIKKHRIPKGFKELLTEFTREILRNQPLDILDFSIEYFKCLQERIVLDYNKKGKNLPCDFKPKIPIIPDNVKLGSGFDQLKRNSKLAITVEVAKEKSENKEEKKEIIIEDKSDEKDNKKETDLAQKEGQIISEPSGGIKTENGPVGEVVENFDEEQFKKINTEGQKSENDLDKNHSEEDGAKQSLLATKSNMAEIAKFSPSDTVSNFYEGFVNCIDFADKESELVKLKEQDPELVGNYVEKIFNPNKCLNDTLVKLQDLVLSYYNLKGTDKEEEFNSSYKNILDELNNYKSQVDLSILDLNFNEMPEADALKQFKSFEYYPRFIKSYLLRLESMDKEENNLLEEICYFLFEHHLKKILDNPNKKARDIINENPFLIKYFNRNFELLSPELFSFVKGLKFYNQDDIQNIYTNFSIRKRELCFYYSQFFYISEKDKKIRNNIDLLENCRFISSPKQICEKLNQADGENNQEIYEAVTEKINQNYIKISKFITRVIDTPIDLVIYSSNLFMQCNSIERDIIIKYLGLNQDYADIKDRLSSIEIDRTESDFNSIMKKLWFDFQNIPDLDYRNNYIYRSHMYTIPESCKGILDSVQKGEIDEDKIIDEFKDKNVLAQNGIYLYLLIKDKEEHKLESLLKKLLLIKNKVQAEEYKIQCDSLKNNYTIDTDEFGSFITEYKEWKNNLNKEILDYFDKSDEEKTEYFKSLPDYPEKVILYYVLKIENAINENEPYTQILEEYQNLVPQEMIKKSIVLAE